MQKIAIFTLLAVAVAASGCSGSGSSGGSDAASGAAATPMPKGTTDKRTGLPVYPGAVYSSTSDSSAGKMTSFMSDDSEQTIAAWYKGQLPSAFADTDNSGNASDPTIEFDKTANGVQTAKVYLSTLGQKTSISVELVK